MIQGRAVAVLVIVLVAGCDVFWPSPTSGPPDGTESMPSPAGLVVTGEPKITDRPVELTLLRPDQPDFRQVTRIAGGDVMAGDFAVSAGSYRLTGSFGPGLACGLDVTLAPSTTTFVVFRPGSGVPCFFEVVSVDSSGY